MGRTVKWELKLMDQGITYAPRTAIKSQVLADFIVEWTEIQMPSAVVDQEYWTMYFDGSLMKKGAGAGLVFVSPLGVCAKSFILVESELYKQSHTGILQHCIPIEQAKRLLSDIHGGVYGHHATPRTLVGNAFR